MNERPDSPGSKNSDLKRKTALSILWTITRAASDQLFAFIVFVVLARILSKADIGIYAIAYVFAETGRVIATNAVTQLVAKSKTVEDQFINTVFWSNVGVALFYAILVLFGASLAGQFFEIPELNAVLRVMALAVVINALGATHMALRLREFGHKTVAIRSIVSGIIGGGAAIGAAMLGFGVWSLVIQKIINESIGALLSWNSYRWTPSFQYDFTIARKNLSFGGDLTFAQLIFLFLVRIQDFIIGGALGVAMVGVYRVAWRLIEIFAVGAIQPFSTVALQTFSRLSDNPPEMRNAYRTLIRLCSSVSFPAVVGLGVLSPELVWIVFGAKWAEAGALGQVFAFMAVPFTLNYFASPVLSAMGDGRKQRTLATIQLVLTVGLTMIAVHWGLTWVAICYVARSYITLPLQMRFLAQSSGIKPMDTWRAIKWPFICSAGMGAALYTLKVLYPMPALGTLAIGIPSAVLLYMVTIGILCPDLIKQIREFAFRKNSKKGVV